VRIDAAPHDCRSARSFREAFDVASWGQVALALMSFGLFEDVLADGPLGWSLDAMTEKYLLQQLDAQLPSRLSQIQLCLAE
jgi:hypothetical protein